MNLILSLEKDALNAMRLELMRYYKVSGKHGASHLHHIRFDEFCGVLLDRISERDERQNVNEGYFSSVEFTSIVRSIILYFDAVDVDSRGVISFADFTNFCLRIGRMRFKTSIKRPVANYCQNQTKTACYPTYKLCFVTHDQTLYGFDSDTPTIRIYRYDT
jgi:hypothetical protein